MIILASGSPRRRELLSSIGIEFEVYRPDADETKIPGESPSELCRRLAGLKAEAGALAFPDDVVIAADTIVVIDGEILGKPRDADDACAMLRKLSGKTHQVYTGYCLLKGDKTVSGTVCSDVTFKELSDEEITHYVSKYKPFDKAGAYGIQEWIGYIGITGIRGSYYNVMGLPVQRIYEELKRIMHNS